MADDTTAAVDTARQGPDRTARPRDLGSLHRGPPAANCSLMIPSDRKSI